MTRRDRAALALALECLRASGDDGGSVLCALGAGDELARDIHDAAYACWEEDGPDDPEGCNGLAQSPILRARLALLLRAMLRAEAGDCGPSLWTCSICKRTFRYRTIPRIHEPQCFDVTGHPRWEWSSTRRITPAWQSPSIASRAAAARERMAEQRKARGQ